MTRIRRLPVTDDTGVPIGIVTLDDLIGRIAEQLKVLAVLIGKRTKSGKEIPLGARRTIRNDRVKAIVSIGQ